MNRDSIEKVSQIIQNAKHLLVFTGAGVSFESGIPTFRGENGLWAKYDPIVLDLSYYFNHTKESWKVIKELFYDFFGKSQPNPAHQILANWENEGILKSIITQNIDNLHQVAGSKNVIEYHGNSQQLICTQCKQKYTVHEIDINCEIPHCPKCKGLLKPDFVFFGESIPQNALIQSDIEASQCDVMLIIGSTGEVYPAAQIPYRAKSNQAIIIEIDPNLTTFTKKITDIHIKAQASIALQAIDEQLHKL